MQKEATVSEAIRQLSTMKRPGLAKLWKEHIGKPANLRMGTELMRPVLAFRIQEAAYGGHSPDTRRRLREIAKALAPESRAQDEAHNRYEAGTRIIREWGGKTSEVLISGSGYLFEGKTYKSLSPIATLARHRAKSLCFELSERMCRRSAHSAAPRFLQFLVVVRI